VAADRDVCSWRGKAWSRSSVQQLLSPEAQPSPLSRAFGPPKPIKTSSCVATTLTTGAAFPLIIPTGAQRSGGTCGSAVYSWATPVQQQLSQEAPPSPLSSRPERSVVERSAVLSWKRFSTGVQRVGGACGSAISLLGDSCSATTVPGSAALPFVISTGAQRSGEISVWMLFLGNVFLERNAA